MPSRALMICHIYEKISFAAWPVFTSVAQPREAEDIYPLSRHFNWPADFPSLAMTKEPSLAGLFMGIHTSEYG